MNPLRSKTTFVTPAFFARSATSVPIVSAAARLPVAFALRASASTWRRRERAAGDVVDHLRVDVVQAPEDREPRALGGSEDLLPDVLLAAQPPRSLDLV